jgi:hypothetical protein
MCKILGICCFSPPGCWAPIRAFLFAPFNPLTVPLTRCFHRLGACSWRDTLVEREETGSRIKFHETNCFTTIGAALSRPQKKQFINGVLRRQQNGLANGYYLLWNFESSGSSCVPLKLLYRFRTNNGPVMDLRQIHSPHFMVKLSQCLVLLVALVIATIDQGCVRECV